jgi:uncharacterized protein (DUF362 family)/Pyruvate/2-oxoacid:ferredoxin oxidoreductase delta subunit
MPIVYARRSRYDAPDFRYHVFAILDGLRAPEFIGKNSRVLIKPNLLAPAPPAKAMLTHPAVVRAVVDYVLDRGASVQISDSPAIGSFDRVLRVSGIKAALEGLPVDFRAFEASAPVDVAEPFQRIEIAADAVRADVLINLPKLKTHSQMLLTLGVKNLFGCIVGFRKPEWHLRNGVDRAMFARLLVEIHAVLRPAITLLDGVLAMEGEGPGMSGSPRPLGVILGSDDAVALDATVCSMLGLDPDMLFTHRAARARGLLEEPIQLDGDLPRVTDFRLPEIAPVVFGPRLFHGLLRKHLVQRPVAACACKLCGTCWQYCPAHAITPGSDTVTFDYDRCIRCYCCLEVCPHGALAAREPLIGQAFRRIMGWLAPAG